MDHFKQTEIDSWTQCLDLARAQGKLSPTAAENIRVWLTQSPYATYAPDVARLLLDNAWPILEQVFWTRLAFGTAGRRGVMFPVGCNAINPRTVGETVAAAAEYAKSQSAPTDPLRAAVGYDVRHHSREFAELSLEILAAFEFQIYFLDQPRGTPQLALAVRHFHCQLGIMITASHNPPTDNAVKVFWSHGGQLRSPHEERVAQRVTQVSHIPRLPFDVARSRNRISRCLDEIDRLYCSTILKCGGGLSARHDMPILYSPLQGVGRNSVLPVLLEAGFDHVELYPPHADPDPDFTHVPRRIANPENPAVFEELIQYANRGSAELILASDPDADRIGAAVRHPRSGQEWSILNGNQIAVLLAEHLLRRRAAAGRLHARLYLVKTIVTSPLMNKIGARYGIRVFGDVLTGFKWLGGVIEDEGPQDFVLAAEEAHGYLVGDYIRDKDAAGASLILAEFANQLRSEKHTLIDAQHALYAREGVHVERSFSLSLEGPQGMQRMERIMIRFRSSFLNHMAGTSIAEWRDYQAGCIHRLNGPPSKLDGPQGNVLVARSEDRCFSLAVRPSGTEPKLKFYLFANGPPCDPEQVQAQVADLQRTLQIACSELEGLCREEP